MAITLPQRNAIHETLHQLADDGDQQAVMTWALHGANAKRLPVLSEGASFRKLLGEIQEIITCTLTAEELASAAFVSLIRNMKNQLQRPTPH